MQASCAQRCRMLFLYVCHLEISLKWRTLYSGFADELSEIMTMVGVQHFILPLLRSLGERCVDPCLLLCGHDLTFV